MSNQLLWLLLLVLCACEQTSGHPPFENSLGLADQYAYKQQALDLLQKARQERYLNADLALQLCDSTAGLPKASTNEAVLAAIDYIKCTMTPSAIPAREAYQACQKAVLYYQDNRKVEATLLGEVLNYSGIHQDILGNKDSSIHFFHLSITKLEDAGDKYYLSEVLNNTGVTHSHNIDQRTAINYYIQALAMAEDCDNVQAQQFAHINLGRSYHRQLLYQRSITHFQEAFAIGERSKVPYLKTLTLTFLADALLAQGKLDEAEAHYLTAKDYNRENDHSYTEIILNISLAKLYLAYEDQEAAEQVLLENDSLLAEYGNKKMKGETYSQWGHLLLQKEQLEAAFTKFDIAESLLEEVGENEQLIELYGLRAVAHEQRGQYAEALVCQKKATSLKEVLTSLRNASLVSALETEYKLDKKETEIASLRQESSTRTWQLLLALLGGALIFLFLLIILRQFRKNQRLSEELEDRVNLRTRELEESNQALQRFAFIASHDLKTPLRTISSFLGLIRRRIVKLKDDQLEEFVDFARSGAQQMSRIVDDVLEFSRMNNPAQHSEYRCIDLNKVAQQVVDNISAYQQSKKAVITIESLPIVKGNEAQLHQVLQNLILNGLKYNESKSPEIHIKACDKKPDFFCLQVSDNGIGIDPEFHGTIFKMFKRLHSNCHYEGTGIGLALCKMVVEQHHGQIWVENNEQGGSTFYFTVPKPTNGVVSPAANRWSRNLLKAEK